MSLVSCYGAIPTAVKSAKDGSKSVKKSSKLSSNKSYNATDYDSTGTIQREKTVENNNFNEWLRCRFEETIDNRVTNNIFKNQLPSMLNSIQAFPKKVRDSIKSCSDFEEALEITLGLEKGYSDKPNDKGGRTKDGITWGTYKSWLSRNGNEWRKEHNLSYIDPKEAKNKVKYITEGEVREIYLKDYWFASGADKISDFKMAAAVFDTAVLNGVGTSINLYKQSGGDLETFLELRRATYYKIVDRDPRQKEFLDGWLKRVNFLKRKFCATNA